MTNSSATDCSYAYMSASVPSGNTHEDVISPPAGSDGRSKTTAARASDGGSEARQTTSGRVAPSRCRGREWSETDGNASWDRFI